MADITDVGEALVALIANAIYPNGIAQPSISACPVYVYQGWPEPQQLENYLKSGGVHVTVYNAQNTGRVVNLYGDGGWDELTNDGTTGTAMREVMLEQDTMHVAVWAPSFALRDAVGRGLKSKLAATTRLAMPDGTEARMSFARSNNNDADQKIGVYRRDFVITVHYSTVEVDALYTIKQIDTSLGVVADIADPLSPRLGPLITLSLTDTTLTTTITP